MSRKPPISMRMSKRSFWPLWKASAMTEAEVDDLRSLRCLHALNHPANLPIRMVRVLVEQSCSQLDLERLVFQQIDERGRRDRQRSQNLGGSSAQLAPAFAIVGVRLGILHQRRRGMDLPQKHALHPLGEFGRSLLDFFQRGFSARVVYVVCGFARRFLQ